MNRQAAKSEPLLHQYEGKGLLYRFVYRTAQRRLLAELRRRRREKASTSIDGCEIGIYDEDSSMLTEVKVRLAEILDDLSDRERIILRMLCEGRPLTDIGPRVGISAGNVSRNVGKIVAHVRIRLGDLAESMPAAATLISDLLDTRGS